jgi:hypothetical protein
MIGGGGAKVVGVGIEGMIPLLEGATAVEEATEEALARDPVVRAVEDAVEEVAAEGVEVITTGL